METTQPINPLDELLPVIAQAIADWQVIHTPDAIKKRVTKLLDESREEIVFKLLGFDKSSWEGKWNLDHCNGRSGESAAGDYLRNVQADAIKEWLSAIPMPTISPKMVTDFKKQYQQEFNQRVQYQLQKLITAEADKRAAELFKNISSSTQLDDYIKTMKLINPKGSTHAN